MLAVGDTLVVGLAGRLAGLNPSNGSIRWEAPIATPRGINDVERLVDLVGRVSRQGDVVCARAFQASVGCVNAARGNLLWTKPANGVQGVDGDDRFVFGTEADGNVIAWRRTDGERAWTTDRLRYRSLTAPVVVGRSIAIGDFSGFVHLLSREDGSLLNRLPTDGTAIAATPVLVGNTLDCRHPGRRHLRLPAPIKGLGPRQKLIDETCHCASRPPQCGQVDAFQPADQDAGCDRGRLRRPDAGSSLR
jgi:outer membrane protein assembly factor BamB